MSIAIGRLLLTGVLLHMAVPGMFAAPLGVQTSQADPGQAATDLDVLQKQVAARPDWTEGWWKLGTAAYEANRFDIAVGSLQRVARAAPRMGLAWDLLGLSEFGARQYKDAQVSLERAATLNNSGDSEVDRVAAYHLSLLRIRDGNFESATTLLRTTFGTNPNSQASLAMALAILRVRLLPSEVDPSREAFLVQVGSAAARGEDGLEDFARTTTANPTVPLLHLAYGKALQHAGRRTEALGQFEREVRVSPQSAAAWRALAESQQLAGDTKAGRAADEKAASLKGSEASEEARSRRWFANDQATAGPADVGEGMRAYAAGQYQLAEQKLSSWVGLHANDGTAWAVLGLSEFRLHEYDNALVHLERGEGLGLNGDPQAVSDAHYTLGLLYLRNGEFDRASLQFTMARRLTGEADRIDAAFGFVLLRVTALPGDTVEPLMIRAGRIQEMLLDSRYDEALPAFDALIAEHPDTAYLHYAYGSALMALSEFDKASGQMLAEERISPRSPLPYEALASIALREHRASDALEPARRAIALLPAAAEPHYLLGRALLESHMDLSTAVGELERAAALDPNSPEIHFSLAKAYARSSDPDRAAKERAIFVRLNDQAEAQKNGEPPQVYSGPRRESILSDSAAKPGPPR